MRKETKCHRAALARKTQRPDCPRDFAKSILECKSKFSRHHHHLLLLHSICCEYTLDVFLGSHLDFEFINFKSNLDFKFKNFLPPPPPTVLQTQYFVINFSSSSSSSFSSSSG